MRASVGLSLANSPKASPCFNVFVPLFLDSECYVALPLAMFWDKICLLDHLLALHFEGMISVRFPGNLAGIKCCIGATWHTFDRFSIIKHLQAFIRWAGLLFVSTTLFVPESRTTSSSSGDRCWFVLYIWILTSTGLS